MNFFGLFENLAHWFTENAISGLELVDKYIIIPTTDL